MADSPQRKLYSVVETAELLKSSEADVEWLIRTGQLQPIRLRGKLYILATDIDELLRVYQLVESRRRKSGN